MVPGHTYGIGRKNEMHQINPKLSFLHLSTEMGEIRWGRLTVAHQHRKLSKRRNNHTNKNIGGQWGHVTWVTAHHVAET